MQNALNELMHYYHFGFFIFYAVALVPIINLIKASLCKRRIAPAELLLDLAVHGLLAAGLVCGAFFLGVWSDVDALNESARWLSRMFVIFGVNVFFSAAYVVVFVKKRARYR